MAKVLAALGLLIAACLVVADLATAQDVTSLRGVQVDEPTPLPPVAKQEKRRFARAYRQQPPLIPHAITQYQIDMRVNQCLGCHDWTNAGERQAPTLSMTHYLDRDGRQLDRIAGTRWFCTQCHVSQDNVEPLVGNAFVPSSGN